MEKLREELSAAVALTTLGVPTMRTPQLAPPVSLELLELQHRINMDKKLHFERSIAAAIARQQQQQREGNDALPRTTPNSRGPKRNFAQKLFDLLQTGLHNDIIRWLPGGKAFIVLDKRRFANEILPNYFKESQYTSFTRKLSRWKFTRVSRGPYMGAYYHKNFRSDNRVLCKLMSCNNSKLNKKEDEEHEEKSEDVENLIENSQKKIQTEAAVASNSTETTEPKAPTPRPESTSPEPKVQDASPNVLKKDMLNQVTTLESNMNSTNQNILLIKKQLMEIRLRKARVEEKKQILMMQQAEARRLQEIERLRHAVNLSIQQAESNIIAAAARALNRSNHSHQSRNQERPLYQTGSLQAPWSTLSRRQDMSMAGNPLAFKRIQLINGNIHQLRNHPKSSTKTTRNARAFAA